MGLFRKKSEDIKICSSYEQVFRLLSDGKYSNGYIAEQLGKGKYILKPEENIVIESSRKSKRKKMIQELNSNGEYLGISFSKEYIDNSETLCEKEEYIK